MPKFKFFEENILGHKSTIFKTLKPNAQETAQKIFKYLFYKSVLELFFTHINPWTSIIYLKKTSWSLYPTAQPQFVRI
jgi:hypothetical protein